MRQRLAQELLDDDAGTAEEIARSLDDLGWIHQHLGGVASWRQLFNAWARAAAPLPARLRLLDVGAGTGVVTASLRELLAARGCPAQAWALDRRRSHLQPQTCPSLAADAYRLPFADRSWDLVTCNLFLHHFHNRPGLPQAQLLLTELTRVARCAVLINDLERHWLAYLTIRLMAPRFSRLTRYDGPRSVRQAYTAPELEALAAGRSHQLLKLSHYRLGLILWCGHGL
ncbi:MAG: methyltransferase domain-containing protein [Terriglobales bacterium]